MFSIKRTFQCYTIPQVLKKKNQFLGLGPGFKAPFQNAQGSRGDKSFFVPPGTEVSWSLIKRIQYEVQGSLNICWTVMTEVHLKYLPDWLVISAERQKKCKKLINHAQFTPNYECWRQHLAWLAAHYNNKGLCKIWTKLVKGFLGKDEKRAKKHAL